MSCGLGGGDRDVGGAVVGERVVPLGMLVQFVGALQVVEEDFARQRRLYRSAKDVHLFVLAVVGAQADDIALVAGDVGKRVLAKESADGGITLANHVAGLDGHGNVALVAEVEADNRMRDPG